MSDHDGPCCDSCLEDLEWGYMDIEELGEACCCKAVPA